MNYMRIFRNLFALLVLGTVFYFRADIVSLFVKPPCTEPIGYTIGTFSPEFKISEEYFLDALAEAEAIWEGKQGDYPGIDLFAHAPDGSGRDTLKVNLIYDYRQEATDKLGDLGINVKNTRESYESLKARMNALRSAHEREKAEFDVRLASFNAEKRAYENEVQYWNKKGGAPKAEYDRIRAEGEKLEAESSELKRMQASVNSKVDQINAMVVVLNKLISNLNLAVDKYNTVSTSRGETFEEGVYYQEGGRAEIDIYEFSSRDKLLRVLAHEFGHALSLGHLEDPEAIMYKLNQGDKKVLSKTDLAALKLRCGVE